MKFVAHNKINGLIKEVKYPRRDVKPVDNLDPNIEIYVLNEADRSGIDTNCFDVKVSYELTDLAHEEHKHLKVCNEIVTTTQKSNEAIIAALNDSFGRYIDALYPLYTRIKDISFPTDKSVDRIERERLLRAVKDNRENDLINNSILPSFDWEW